MAFMQSFDTGTVCRQIKYILDTPAEPFVGVLDPRHDWRIDVKGPPAYLDARKKELSAPGVKVRTFNTDGKALAVKESEGVDRAYQTYLNLYVPKCGTPLEVLRTMTQERLNVQS